MDKCRRKEILTQTKEAVYVKPGQRKMSQLLKSFFKNRASAPKTLVIPSVKSKQGSTKHYPCYNINKEQLIMAFVANLCSTDGGLREHNLGRAFSI